MDHRCAKQPVDKTMHCTANAQPLDRSCIQWMFTSTKHRKAGLSNYLRSKMFKNGYQVYKQHHFSQIYLPKSTLVCFGRAQEIGTRAACVKRSSTGFSNQN